MQSDRELLELAAKAAAIETVYWNDGREVHSSGEGFILPSNRLWNPLDDDGDALRLATKLRIDIYFWGTGVEAEHGDIPPQPIELFKDCDNSATRRAIVRTAAAIAQNREQKDA